MSDFKFFYFRHNTSGNTIVQVKNTLQTVALDKFDRAQHWRLVTKDGGYNIRNRVTNAVFDVSNKLYVDYNPIIAFGANAQENQLFQVANGVVTVPFDFIPVPNKKLIVDEAADRYVRLGPPRASPVWLGTEAPLDRRVIFDNKTGGPVTIYGPSAPKEWIVEDGKTLAIALLDGSPITLVDKAGKPVTPGNYTVTKDDTVVLTPGFTAKPPGPPTGLFADTAEFPSAKVFFTAPADDGGAAITSYKVVVTPTTGDPIFVKPTDTFVKLDGLKYDTDYQVSIVAINEKGESTPASVSFKVQAPPPPTFKTGLWKGWFKYGTDPTEHPTQMEALFLDGKVSGFGSDEVGKFTLEGTYDEVTGAVSWVKTYIGAHSITYEGKLIGERISGNWNGTGGPFEFNYVEGPKPGAFKSGFWEGWYQYASGTQEPTSATLTFYAGAVAGVGTDTVGDFRIHGHYDEATGFVTWEKTYVGAHTLTYTGKLTPEGAIIGTWKLPGNPAWGGPFQLNFKGLTKPANELIVEIPKGNTRLTIRATADSTNQQRITVTSSTFKEVWIGSKIGGLQIGEATLKRDTATSFTVTFEYSKDGTAWYASRVRDPITYTNELHHQITLLSEDGIDNDFNDGIVYFIW